MDTDTQNSMIVPFYTELDRYTTYSNFDSGLIKYSKILICYADRPRSIDYCSVHLIIPAKFPKRMLGRLNKEWPEFVSISNPLVAFLLNMRDHTSDNIHIKLLRFDVDSWKDILPHLSKVFPHFESVLNMSMSSKLSNRSRRYLRASDKAIQRILRGENVKLPGKELIIPHIEASRHIILPSVRKRENTSSLDHRPFADLKLEDIYGE